MNGGDLYVPFGDGFADDLFIPLGLAHRFELFGGRRAGGGLGTFHPFAVSLDLSERGPRLFVLGIELNYPFEVFLLLGTEALTLTPLGEFVMTISGVGGAFPFFFVTIPGRLGLGSLGDSGFFNLEDASVVWILRVSSDSSTTLPSMTPPSVN